MTQAQYLNLPSTTGTDVYNRVNNTIMTGPNGQSASVNDQPRMMPPQQMKLPQQLMRPAGTVAPSPQMMQQMMAQRPGNMPSQEMPEPFSLTH